MFTLNKCLIRCVIGLSFTFLLLTLCSSEEVQPMSREERLQLKEEARDMFYHAYRAYMENAYPADELMPLSCEGRYRGLTPNRGDIDDALGNFSLTLIDTLDTLVILGDLEEFEHAVKLVIKDVSFDNDVIVSVFETNIRVLGGLLSAHILAEYLQQKTDLLQWYKGELLDMAKDLGYRLLPAFNTTTGIPHARVNLKYGIKSDRLESAKETCTACAGSVILEMAALSRLSGEPIFEEKAHKSMNELWKMRHRSSDLMGTVLNVHSGDWVRRDSGVGAGIDSYYEYCLKAYILLGDDRYLNRFNRHYSAIMKYISQGPMLLDVHMHRPHTNSRNYMDALLAFWPGLQVLKGDIKPAVETHEMLYQVMQRHKFIPEAFTTDFQVHWGNHPLRPEFLESTYFLYGATNDPYYLEVGKNVLKSLQKYARVPCGYAAVNDVRTGKQEDRMDSFVLAETFKYLYLLFADKEDLILNLDEFIFTTEGHLLPLSLAVHTNSSKNGMEEDLEDYEFARTCPNTLQLFPETVRKPLRNMVDGICPRRAGKRKLTATEFSASNLNHLKIIKDMGINIIALNDGRVQLLHTFSAARSTADAEEGLLFMQEMVELSKLQSQQPEASPQAVSFPMKLTSGLIQTISVQAGPSHFGVNLKDNQQVTGRAIIIHPFRACTDLPQGDRIRGKIAVMERGDCMFVDKARRIQKAGAIGGIIIDNTPGSSAATSPMFSMSGDGSDDVSIPTVFLFSQDASKLLLSLSKDPAIDVTISEYKSTNSNFWSSNEDESVFQKIKISVQEFLNKHTGIAFTEVVKVGGFKADVGADKIRITYDKTEKGEEDEGERYKESVGKNGREKDENDTDGSGRNEERGEKSRVGRANGGENEGVHANDEEEANARYKVEKDGLQKDGGKDEYGNYKDRIDKYGKDEMDKDGSYKDTIDKDRIDKDRTDKDRTDKDRTNKDRTDKDTTDKDRTDKDRIDKDMMDKVMRGTDKDPIDKDRINKDMNKDQKDKNGKDKLRKEDNENFTNQQWSQLKKGLLQSILHSDTKELFVPLNILRIYYLSLSGLSPVEVLEHSVRKQTEWLLKELSAEHHKKEDDMLVTVDKGREVTLLPNKVSEKDVLYGPSLQELYNFEDSRQKLQKLNSIFQAINQIEKDVIQELKKSDDLVISGERKADKVILSKEQLEASEGGSATDRKDNLKKSHASDEL